MNWTEEGTLFRRGFAAAVAVLALQLFPWANPLAGQELVVVRGSVVDATSAAGVTNAIVTLEGQGGVLSNDAGEFRFERVAPGSYSLTVLAFGYVDLTTSIVVADETQLTIPLEPEPIALDSLSVEASTVDLDGRVRDDEHGANVYDAQIVSDQGHRVRTGWHGRFDLGDVYEGVPIRLIISGFGFAPLDTTLTPEDDDDRHDFELGPDSIGLKMIAAQAQRLDDRANDTAQVYRPYHTRPTVDRDDMARYASRATLQTMLESMYNMRTLRRVGCFVIDERAVRSRVERTHVLQTMLPQEVERIEVIEFPDQAGVLMMRVYTRRFFQQLVATNRPLRTPNYVGITRTCL